MSRFAFGAGGRRGDPADAPSGSPGSAGEVFRVFFLLGLTSFGGPIAHIGYFRSELVGRRAWLPEARFAELVGLCQFVPGPASSQLGFALGLLRAGWSGALAAWLGFTLPSAVLLMALAQGARLLQGAAAQGVLAGLQAVAVAVVLHAVAGMARSLTPDAPRILIGLLALGVALAAPPVLGQPGAILLGAGLGVLLCRSKARAGGGEPLGIRIAPAAAVGAATALAALLLVLPFAARAVGGVWLPVIDASFRAGTLVFGGGHVVLPLLQAEPAISSAVGSDVLLGGYGGAQAVPGPLFTFAAYLGAAALPGLAGIGLGVAALIAVFLPGFLILVAVLPLWDRIRQNRLARAALAGAGAAVVGILAAALVGTILPHGITSPITGVIAALVLVGLLLKRVPVWCLVLGAGAAGALSGMAGVA